jgi:hypothetical protein
MAQAAAAARAGSAGAPRYTRHRPEQTLLYRIDIGQKVRMRAPAV